MDSNESSGDVDSVNSADTRLRACGTCGLVQRVPELQPGTRARCPRCQSIVARPPSKADANSIGATSAFAIAALLLYPLAVGLPFMSITRLGHHTNSSILESCANLLDHGDFVVGGVVLFCSVILPLAKLTGLLLISNARGWMRRKHTAATWRMIELAGRWGMIDVLLAAVLLAMLKLGDLVTVEPAPGLFAFTTCVLLSLAASATFDPHSLWETE